jgi:hypothetical protein
MNGPNALELYLAARNLPEGRAMDALQNANVISDNCVAVHDVAKPDDAKAVEWLKKNYREKTR